MACVREWQGKLMREGLVSGVLFMIPERVWLIICVVFGVVWCGRRYRGRSGGGRRGGRGHG